MLLPRKAATAGRFLLYCATGGHRDAALIASQPFLKCLSLARRHADVMITMIRGAAAGPPSHHYLFRQPHHFGARRTPADMGADELTGSGYRLHAGAELK